VSASVVVTGCGTGIGRAIFERLLRDGWSAVGIELDAALAADARSAAGSHGEVIEGDVADRATLEDAATRAVAHAPLGGWVNNAALAIAGNLHDPDPEGVARLFSVNLLGVYWGCSTAVQTFIAQRSTGAIVNISSIHGRTAFTGWAAYDTAKGGVDALTRYVAVEYGPVGIRANAIAPGAIRTPLLQRVVESDADPARAEHEMAILHPLERLGEPEEIAAAAAFLLSSESSFITGQSIAVDGGASSRCWRYDPPADLLAAYAPSDR
jgi:NAD(P)-dependent dehydrogenase (short-subunit alcohol dehydrogenase family)